MNFANVTISETGRGYEIQFEYRKNIVAEIKEMPGYRFFGKEKGWFIPYFHVKKTAGQPDQEFHNRPALEKFKKKYMTVSAGSDEPEKFFKIKELPELTISLPWKPGTKPFHYQDKGIARGLQLKRFINADEPGTGKLQGVNDRVLTPQGWRLMGDILTGDYVIGSNGCKTKVTAIYPQGKKQLYRIMFSDGFSVTAGAEHLWAVQKKNSKSHFVFTTAQLMDENGFITRNGTGWNAKKPYKFITYFKDKDGSSRWKIPMVKSVNFDCNNVLPIEPYLLGIFLGDGHSGERSATLTLFDKDFESMKPFLSRYSSFTPAAEKSSITVHLSTDFKEDLKLLGLHRKLHDKKSIPSIYLTASIEDRLSLIQGLMDSDGHASHSSTEFSTTSKMLCDGLVELVQSLGGIARVKTKEKPQYKYLGEMLTGKKAYRVNVKMPPGINPFRCERKASAYCEPYHYLPERYIRSIEPDRIEEAVCIAVDAPDHLYVTDHYIVTHNTIQSIGTALAFEQSGINPWPCLIICPATLKENWRREIEEKFTNKRAIVLSDKTRDNWPGLVRMGMGHFVIVNYESLWSYFVLSTNNKGGTQPKMSEINFTPLIGLFKSLIIDEAHRLRNDQNKQSKVAKAISVGKEIIMLLTGTPIVNKPNDLVPLLSIMGRLPEFGGFKYYLDRYCAGGSGAGNLNELNGKLNNTCFFRREKKDVLQDLPDKMREIFTCDITTRAEYAAAKGDLGKFLREQGYSEKQVNKSLNAEIMVKIGVLKAISARGKLPEAIEHIQEVVDAGQKIVVFIHQKFMAESLLKAFPGAVSVRGDDDRESRQWSVDAFQNDPKVLVIICSIKAAGVGITLTASSRLVFLELPWHPADTDQCEDRIHRIGQKNAAQISYFLGKDTIDEDIYKIIEKKRGISDAILGQVTEIDTMITDITRSLFNQR